MMEKAELIDTLWNVNTYFMIKSWALSCELIDTLWNVNMEKSFKEFFFDS